MVPFIDWFLHGSGRNNWSKTDFQTFFEEFRYLVKDGVFHSWVLQHFVHITWSTYIIFGVSSQLFRILHTLFYPCLDTLNTHSYSPLTHEKMPLFLIFILTDALDPSKEVSRTPPPSQIIVMILNDVDQLMFIKGFCVCLKILMRP